MGSWGRNAPGSGPLPPFGTTSQKEGSMKQLSVFTALSLALAAPIASGTDSKFRLKLTGFQEVPSVSTEASGEFEARIGRNDTYIDFELSYRGLQGPVRQGHIHVAQKGVNGVIVIWLCQTTLNPAPP